MKVRRMIAVATFAGAGVLMSASPAMAGHPQPTSKEDCKDGGFAEYRMSAAPDAEQRFKNQGQCVRFVQTGKG